jgi:hypothetical protein
MVLFSRSSNNNLYYFLYHNPSNGSAYLSLVIDMLFDSEGRVNLANLIWCMLIFTGIIVAIIYGIRYGANAWMFGR